MDQKCHGDHEQAVWHSHNIEKYIIVVTVVSLVVMVSRIAVISLLSMVAVVVMIAELAMVAAMIAVLAMVAVVAIVALFGSGYSAEQNMSYLCEDTAHDCTFMQHYHSYINESCMHGHPSSYMYIIATK